MTEFNLIRKARDGSEKAFKELFDQYASRLYRFLKQFSKDNDLVEDWVQQAFIKAFRNIDKYEGRSKFITWLFQIGINEMRNEYARKNIFEKDFPPEIEFAGEDRVDETFEWYHDMKWLLSDLDEEKRAVFILFEIEGYAHSEISEMLGITEQNSRTTLCRTKTYLRKKWNDERG